jgi:hypothetical protein
MPAKLGQAIAVFTSIKQTKEPKVRAFISVLSIQPFEEQKISQAPQLEPGLA